MYCRHVTLKFLCLTLKKVHLIETRIISLSVSFRWAQYPTWRIKDVVVIMRQNLEKC
ncbi:hypothetical protein C0J52_05795 [Blattella germanica]|nr:hypothetical protein C0J52_05795 [Blattella germanica]